MACPVLSMVVKNVLGGMSGFVHNGQNVLVTQVKE
jgi:hypothetical protein